VSHSKIIACINTHTQSRIKSANGDTLSTWSRNSFNLQNYEYETGILLNHGVKNGVKKTRALFKALFYY